MSDFEKLRREATPGPWEIRGTAASPNIVRRLASACSLLATERDIPIQSVCFIHGFQDDPCATADFIASIHAIDDARIAAEARVAKLEKQLEIAVACLSEFADENNYHEGFCDYVTYSINGHNGYTYTECDLDSSDAKKALAKIREIEE